ncbi:Dienelactone hydrolase [Amycolatopsis sacchari]|uniref:Dienelactone hydrolase n=2 Tax=Amycolatopsis sacchari TaxID=115433 RepID=A0A1I3Q0G9_9PSEU|nr:Dienelactone hydrolase [Amycolatopsis sacchari]
MRRSAKAWSSLVFACAMAVGTLAANPAEASPYQHGPDPTESSIEATTGPYQVSRTTVSSLSVSGFGGGTIYYPTTTSEGTFAAVAIAPGYTADQSSISWIGPRLASQGFVVFTIDTLTRYDQPASRGDQLLAALDYLTGRSSVRTRIDASRLGVAGHSMGGGGTLEAAKDRPSLQAAVPLAPWDLNKDFSSVTVPTFIIGGQSDTVAPVSTHSERFYSSLPSTSDKAYMELRGASHFFPNTPNTTMAKYMISWFKRFLDDDTRYDQFLCPAPDDATISQYLDTCPY